MYIPDSVENKEETVPFKQVAFAVDREGGFPMGQDTFENS